MTARAVFAHEPQPRQSLKVSRAASILDVDESQVRRLIDAGELEAHRQGKRGVRVYLDSVEAYRDRGAIKGRARAFSPSKDSRRPSKASRTAHEAAMADLRADGLV